MKIKAVIYARFSPRPNAAECESIETQVDRCRAWCEAKDLQIEDVLSDANLSGARASNRPGLQKALALVKKHKGALVVYSLSRLCRNTKDAIEISQEIKSAGAVLMSLHESIDTGSAMGSFFYTLISAVAELERAQISERTSDAMKRHQSNGRAMGGTPPYGWMRDPGDPTRLTEHAEEQAAIKTAIEWRKQGLNLRRIAESLTEYGFPCRGKRWHHQAVKRMIEKGGSL